jgi:hypothetical protein
VAGSVSPISSRLISRPPRSVRVRPRTVCGVRYVAYGTWFHYDDHCDADEGRGWRRQVESDEGKRWWFNKLVAPQVRKAPRCRRPTVSRGKRGTSVPPTGSIECSEKKFDQRRNAEDGASPSSSPGRSSVPWTRVTESQRPVRRQRAGACSPGRATSPSQGSDGIPCLRHALDQ